MLRFLTGIERNELNLGAFAAQAQLERRLELDELGFDALRGEQLPVGLCIRLRIEWEALIALGLGARPTCQGERF